MIMAPWKEGSDWTALAAIGLECLALMGGSKSASMCSPAAMMALMSVASVRR